MIAFRRAQIAGSQAARVDNNFLHGDARIYHPDLQNVIGGSSQRVGRLNLADAILDRRFPVSLRVVGQESTICGGWSSNAIANLRPRPGTKFKVGARIASTLHLALQAGSIRRSDAGSGHGKYCHGRECSPVVRDFIPSGGSRVRLARMVRGFDRNIAVGLDKALKSDPCRLLRIECSHSHRDGTGSGAGHRHGAAAGTPRSLAPVHVHPETLIAIDGSVGCTQHDPGLAGAGGEGKWSSATIENINVASLLIENVRHRKGGLRLGSVSRPRRGRAFDCDAQPGGNGNLRLFYLGHDVCRRIVPSGVTDEGLIHHVVPLAVGQAVVVFARQVGVCLE